MDDCGIAYRDLMRWSATSAVVLAALLTGCVGDPDPDSAIPTPSLAATPVAAPWPAGLTAYVDQSRLGRQRGEVFVRLVNDPVRELEVLRAEVSSDRFDTTVWTGGKTFRYEADLDLALPTARCGIGSDATVELTYRVDGGPPTVSSSTATDRYGQVGLQLDRDCAARTLAEAATLTAAAPRVLGTGRNSVFELPVTLTPTGSRADVAFTGFEDTVLFRQVPPSPSVDVDPRVPLTAAAGPTRVVLRLVPTRCDPHALAEDKVGTLVGVRVAAPGLPDVASSYLPLDDATRARLRAFFGTHCSV